MPLASCARHVVHRWGVVIAGALFVAAPDLAPGQSTGEIRGRVLTDSAQQPVPGARARIDRLGLEVEADSAGVFRMRGLRGGDYAVVLRAVGFRPETTEVEVDPDVVTVRDFVLRTQLTVLPGQRVVGKEGPRFTGKLGEFNERKQLGVGHFLDADMLAKDAERGMRMGDVMAKVPGVRVMRGQSKAWISSGRALNSGTCVFCRAPDLNRADKAAGAKPACYMDIYLDGVKIFNSASAENGLFDVNTLQLTAVVGIEVYTSAAQVPVKYNQTSGGCGVMLIWSR